MERILIVPILVSFLVTIFVMPKWIRKMHGIGLQWDDMNKWRSKKVAGSGGMVVVMGFIIGALSFIAYRVFFLDNSSEILIQSLAIISVTCLLAGVGFIDDLFGWRRGGLARRNRIILVAIASIPLIAINAGRSVIGLPFIGSIDIGIIYPLVLVPLGMAGATTTYNFLAGFNGLEAGQGVIFLSALSVVAYLTGSPWLAIIALCMVAALLAFLIFNFDPAIVFPGDALTYAVGGLIAMMAVLGNFEKVAVFFFIPYIIEFFLKARGKLVKQSFGKPKKDGSLSLRYDKIYSLNHVAIWLMEKWKVKPTEKKVVFMIWLFQIIVILIGFALFWEGIYHNV